MTQDCSRCGRPRDPAHLKGGVCAAGCVCLRCNKRLGLCGRGLCATCHGALGRLVRAGQTSWAELESQGKALPVGRPGRGATRRAQVWMERLWGKRVKDSGTRCPPAAADSD